MIRKTKSTKYTDLSISKLKLRPSANIPIQHSQQGKQQLIAQIILQIVKEAEQKIAITNQVLQSFSFFLNKIEKQQDKIIDLQDVNSQKAQMMNSQEEPTIYITPVANKQRRTMLMKTIRKLKPKSQSCGSLTVIKLSTHSKRKIDLNLESLRKCERNEFVSLEQNNRKSQNLDMSEDIQELMRRKKQLQLQTKLEIRHNTQISKPYTTERSDKKQRKLYYQNDDGKGEELKMNRDKFIKQIATISSSNIKCNQSQLILSGGMKKKPIIEMNTRRKRKRMQGGQTCVFIQQLHQTEHLDLQKVLKEAFDFKQGVKITTRTKESDSYIKLPSIR